MLLWGTGYLASPCQDLHYGGCSLREHGSTGTGGMSGKDMVAPWVRESEGSDSAQVLTGTQPCPVRNLKETWPYLVALV